VANVDTYDAKEAKTSLWSRPEGLHVQMREVAGEVEAVQVPPARLADVPAGCAPLAMLEERVPNLQAQVAEAAPEVAQVQGVGVVHLLSCTH
jgi:hypothetical protein